MHTPVQVYLTGKAKDETQQLKSKLPCTATAGGMTPPWSWGCDAKQRFRPADAWCVWWECMHVGIGNSWQASKLLLPLLYTPCALQHTHTHRPDKHTLPHTLSQALVYS